MHEYDRNLPKGMSYSEKDEYLHSDEFASEVAAPEVNSDKIEIIASESDVADQNHPHEFKRFTDEMTDEDKDEADKLCDKLGCGYYEACLHLGFEHRKETEPSHEPITVKKHYETREERTREGMDLVNKALREAGEKEIEIK